jgi:hypothetical protein
LTVRSLSVATPTTHAKRASSVRLMPSEKEFKLAQKLDQLQPFLAVFSLKCMGQRASSGLT